MGKHRRMSDAASQPPIEDSGATYWSVAEGDWPALRPGLPAEVADLLAPPIVVGVARVVATSRMTPPADAGAPQCTPGPVRASAAARSAPPGATTVRLGTAHRATSEPVRRPAPGHHRTA